MVGILFSVPIATRPVSSEMTLQGSFSKTILHYLDSDPTELTEEN